MVISFKSVTSEMGASAAVIALTLTVLSAGLQRAGAQLTLREAIREADNV